MSLTIGSLFSGIGGLEMGLEAALGAETVWQVEQDEYCRKVLAKHWPDADRSVTDVREATADNLAPVDIICGGHPCQDISSANVKGRKGLGGAKSGLWSEFRRLVGALGPRAVVVENSPNWRAWVPIVRRDLWRLGLASLPFRVSAGDFGAIHKRPRCFVVAYAHSEGKSYRAKHGEVASVRTLPALSRNVEAHIANTVGMDDGIPNRSHRLGALGNAVVPQVAYEVGLRLRDRL